MQEHSVQTSHKTLLRRCRIDLCCMAHISADLARRPSMWLWPLTVLLVLGTTSLVTYPPCKKDMLPLTYATNYMVVRSANDVAETRRLVCSTWEWGFAQLG